MKILAIGAHPDDIELGCGGLLIKSARQGHDVQLELF
jgi:LmbE family N-acetylglucosaminyl deacetylase